MITAGLILIGLALVLGAFAWMALLAQASGQDNAAAGCFCAVVAGLQVLSVAIVGVIIGWVNTRA